MLWDRPSRISTGGIRPWFVRIASAACLAAIVLYVLAVPLNADSAWLLYASGLFIDGATPYVDFFETNPPLVLYLNVPAILFAEATGLDTVVALKLWLLALAAFAARLGAEQLRRESDSGSRPPVFPPDILLFALLSLHPFAGFGQREHLILILSLPYVLAHVRRLRRESPVSRRPVLTGVLAGLGFSLKPYTLAVPLLLELTASARHRSLRTIARRDFAAMIATGIAYVGLVCLLHRSYFSSIVPLALAVREAGYARAAGELLSNPVTLWIAISFLVYALGRRAGAFGRREDVVAIAALGFFASYLIQAKGWPNHAAPSMQLLAIASLLPGAPEPEPIPRGTGGADRRPAIRSLLPRGALVLLFSLTLIAPRRVGTDARHIRALVRAFERPATLISVTTYVEAGFPLIVDTRLTWASRFHELWMLPGAVHILESDTNSAAKRHRAAETLDWTGRALARDLECNRPDYVLVDLLEPPTFIRSARFRFLDWLRSTPELRRAWLPYRQIGRVGRIGVYRRGPAEANCAEPTVPWLGSQGGNRQEQ